jgi:hypothetical protein
VTVFAVAVMVCLTVFAVAVMVCLFAVVSVLAVVVAVIVVVVLVRLMIVVAMILSRVREPDSNVGCGYTDSCRFASLVGNIERGFDGRETVGVSPSVEQRAEEHVAARSHSGVEGE